MIMPNASIKAMREELAILPDTHIHVIAGEQQPQYSTFAEQAIQAPIGIPRYTPILIVGIKWLEKHYPQHFAEVISQRLKGNNPTA